MAGALSFIGGQIKTSRPAQTGVRLTMTTLFQLLNRLQSQFPSVTFFLAQPLQSANKPQ
jgi:hypothetical protein